MHPVNNAGAPVNISKIFQQNNGDPRVVGIISDFLDKPCEIRDLLKLSFAAIRPGPKIELNLRIISAISILFPGNWKGLKDQIKQNDLQDKDFLLKVIKTILAPYVDSDSFDFVVADLIQDVEIEKGCIELLDALLSTNCPEDQDLGFSIVCAVQANKPQAIQVLLKYVGDKHRLCTLDPDHFSMAIDNSIRFDYLECLKCLLEKGGYFNQENFFHFVITAVKDGKLEALKLLLNTKYRPDIPGRISGNPKNPDYILKDKDIEKIQQLCDSRRTLDPEQRAKAIQIATEKGHVECADLLKI